MAIKIKMIVVATIHATSISSIKTIIIIKLIFFKIKQGIDC